MATIYQDEYGRVIGISDHCKVKNFKQRIKILQEVLEVTKV